MFLVFKDDDDDACGVGHVFVEEEEDVSKGDRGIVDEDGDVVVPKNRRDGTCVGEYCSSILVLVVVVVKEEAVFGDGVLVAWRLLPRDDNDDKEDACSTRLLLFL